MKALLHVRIHWIVFLSHDCYVTLDMGHPNNAETGAIVACFIAGEAVGSILKMAFGDKLGRKRFMQWLCILVRIIISFDIKAEK